MVYYLTKEARTYIWVKTVSSISGVGKTGHIHAKKMELDHQCTQYRRTKDKRLKCTL